MSASPSELDQPDKVEPIAQPEPRPPRATRPLKLSVTAIEDWLRDPYTIYAKHILKLDAARSRRHAAVGRRPRLGDPRCARRIHQDFRRRRFPTIPRARLRRIGEKYFAPLMERPGGAGAVVAALPAHRQMVCRNGRPRGAAISSAIDAEIRGEIPIPLDNARTFILSARADRIERRRDGSFAILDYKTGQPPTGKQVRMGLSPQLTLEAAILREGGFAGIAGGRSVSELVYVRLSGNNPPGEQRSLELKIKPGDTPQPPDDAADYARAQLEALIRKFENEDEPYRSLNLSMWSEPLRQL